MDIRGSVVLITGANRGIGRAFVEGVAKAGAARIYAAARDPASIGDPRVEAVRLDITDAAQVAEAAAKCDDVTLLINNAGVATFSPFLGAPSMDGARLEMEVNYFGALAMCRAFAPILGRNGGGALVNILSVASFITGGRLGSYSASKMAQLALTRGVRIELRAQGTLVVGVHPGWVDTGMIAHVSAEKASPEQVVEATFAAVMTGQEEVLPDSRSARIREALRQDPASLEREAQRAWDEGLVPGRK
jgi:NAD(P)-dependent dehydrogenase (short-subunit alcohol dehydrogenase family)